MSQDTTQQNPENTRWQGIYHPRLGVFDELADYLAHFPADAPRVGLCYPRNYWVKNNQAHVVALIEAIEARGGVAVPIFCNRFKDATRPHLAMAGIVEKYCYLDGNPALDVMVMMVGMSVNLVTDDFAGVYEKLNIPILQAMNAERNFVEWSASKQGLTALDVAIHAAQPEFDGALITKVIATEESTDQEPENGMIDGDLQPIPGRVEAMAELALNWAKLRRMPNSEKKVAIVFHHEPPRNDRIGAAVGLDSFESVNHLLKQMAKAGYVIEQPYADGDELCAAIQSKLTADRRWLPPDQLHARAQAHADLATMASWFESYPEKNKAELTSTWGPNPGQIFNYRDELSFAGLQNGNVFITVQPPRAPLPDDPDKVDEHLSHDPLLPPSHHYLAHYRWLREVFKADAVIHIGTHGTEEWLPGKSLGLSEECYPELALADLPNIYPYIIDNPGEGTQAKRRGAAALVDHLTPPMTEAGLYGACAQVAATAIEYQDAKAQAPGHLEDVFAQLWDDVVAAGLEVDLEIDRVEAFADPDHFIDHLNHYLMQLADNQIADGLHVLGQLVYDPPASEKQTAPRLCQTARMLNYLGQLTKLPNGDVPSLREEITRVQGFDPDELLANTGQIFALPGGGQQSGGQILLAAHELGIEFLTGGYQLLCEDRLSETGLLELTEELLGKPAPRVALVVYFALIDLLPKLEQVSDEIGSIMNALSGGYISPGPSGAITRGSTAALPSGRNFYSVDPRVLPTRAAWRVGVQLADALLDNYRQEAELPDIVDITEDESLGERRYPKNIGILLWGTVNMRTRGEDIAEILYLMGLRPIWDAGGVVTGLEVIDLAELGRPRLDVTPRISGFFRDAFPNLVELLDDAVQLVAKLNESPEDNLLRAHVLADQAEFGAKGMSEAEAWRLATLRIFGCVPGGYGAGVTGLIESKQWQTRDDLGNSYIRYSAYAYGRDNFGPAQEDAFRTQLARMEVTVKNEDNREVDLLSCTDFYNYYGGLIAAAATVRGELPVALVGDSSDVRNPQSRTATQEARRIMRSRILNPKWIAGLQRHGYKGAGDMSHMMDTLIGWDATADIIDDQLLDQVARRYALDPKMQEWFNEVNPYALHNIIDKLLDMAQRGLWHTDDELVDELTKQYLAVEGEIEGKLDDE